MKELETFFIGYTEKPFEQMTMVDNNDDRKLNRVPEVLIAMVFVTGFATMGLR